MKKLYRSRDDRIVAGIFGGMGRYFDVDPVLLRLIWLVVLLATAIFPAVIVYLLAIFIVPLEPESVGHDSAPDVPNPVKEKSETDMSEKKEEARATATPPFEPHAQKPVVRDVNDSAVQVQKSAAPETKPSEKKRW